jgi:undecaprenyl diphosphate synthase
VVTPRHIAIVMDGNGRWAAQRGLPRVLGHREGLQTVKKIVGFALTQKIDVLSLFAFSTENWTRPQEEVGYLMRLLLNGLQKEIHLFQEKNVKLKVVGDLLALAPEIQQGIREAEALTAHNTQLTVVIAINYGGQWDIAQAAHRFAQAAVEGAVDLSTVSVEKFAPYLCLADLPSVDLFIRTSGELRISNFFLWQMAYAELYFTDVFWPDFNEIEWQKALMSFAERKRRFGGI